MAAVILEIAELLAKGLVSGIGNAVGARIFNSIFYTGGVPSYFTEVYKEIEKIMHQEVTQNTIDDVNGQINGITEWVNNVYTPRKDSGAPKAELYDLMIAKESDIAIHMIAVLMEKTFAESALAVFVIGASIHLVLLQELASVDPDVSDPSKSSYVISIKKYASDYADHAEKTYATIVKERTADNVITTVTVESKEFPPVFGEVPSTHLLFTAKWEDKFTGKEFTDATELMNGKWFNGNNVELTDRAFETRRQYIVKVIKNVCTSLNKPTEACEAWRKLIKNPLPNP